MNTVQTILHYLLHIDFYLLSFVSTYGIVAYILLFLIIFCETGLVIFPFLPGDSLLFAAGSIAANSVPSLDIRVLFISLFIASILGNKINYLVGRKIGPKIFVMDNKNRPFFHWSLNKKHLQKAHEFYEKHGGKAIVFARFIPIVRTFIPFIAGISDMSLAKFSLYNIVSALIWIGSLLGAGYYFGSLPFIKDNFSIVVYGIIGISLLPAIIAFLYKQCGKMFTSSL